MTRTTIDAGRRCAVVAAIAVAAFGARAADAPAPPPRTYAVVSLIGDQFTVVSRRPEVGSRLDPNERTSLPVPDPVFDRIAARAVEKALLDARPGTPVLNASIRDPRLFALQDKLLEESAESHDMRIALHDLLVKAGATDLLLVTKQRAEPTFRIADGRLSSGGVLSGIGFYIDNETRLYTAQRLTTGEGFLAPYAYLRISWIELGSMRVVKFRQGLESTMSLPQDKQAAAHAWDALSAKEKVDALDHAIRQAVAAAMPDLLAP